MAIAASSDRSTIELESALGRRVSRKGLVEVKCRWKSSYGVFEAWEPLSTFAATDSSFKNSYFGNDTNLPECQQSSSSDSDDESESYDKSVSHSLKRVETIIAYKEVQGVPHVFCKWKHESLGTGAWVPLDRVVDKLGLYDLLESARQQWCSRRGIPVSTEPLFNPKPRRASVHTPPTIESQEVQCDATSTTIISEHNKSKTTQRQPSQTNREVSYVPLRPISLPSETYTSSYREKKSIGASRLPINTTSGQFRPPIDTPAPRPFVSSLLTSETCPPQSNSNSTTIPKKPVGSAAPSTNSVQPRSGSTFSSRTSPTDGLDTGEQYLGPILPASEGLVARDLKMIREKLRVLDNAQSFDAVPRRIQVAGPMSLSNSNRMRPNQSKSQSSTSTYPSPENFLLPNSSQEEIPPSYQQQDHTSFQDGTFLQSETMINSGEVIDSCPASTTPPEIDDPTERYSTIVSKLRALSQPEDPEKSTTIETVQITTLDSSMTEASTLSIESIASKSLDHILSQQEVIFTSPPNSDPPSAPVVASVVPSVSLDSTLSMSLDQVMKSAQDVSTPMVDSEPLVLPTMELWARFLSTSRGIRAKLEEIQPSIFRDDMICFCKAAGCIQDELCNLLNSAAVADLIPKRGLKCSLCGGASHFECFVKALEWEFSSISFKYHYRSLKEWITREFLSNWLDGFICIVCRIAQGDPFYPVDEVLQIGWLAPTHTGNFSKLEPLPPRAPGNELMLKVNLNPEIVKQLKELSRALQLRSFRVRSDHTSYPKFPNDEVEIWYLQSREKTMEKLKKPPQLRVRQDTFKLLPKTYVADTSCAQAVKIVAEFESAYDGPYIMCIAKTFPAVSASELIELIKQNSTLSYSIAHDFILNLMFPDTNSNSNSGGIYLSNHSSGMNNMSRDWSESNSGASKSPAIDEDDLSVVTISHKIRLSCPSTLVRIRIPARGSQCKHAQCFDLEFFVTSSPQVHHFSRWQCPVCRLYCRPHELIIDSWTASILNNIDEDIREVSLDVKLDEKTSKRSLFILEQQSVPLTVLSL